MADIERIGGALGAIVHGVELRSASQGDIDDVYQALLAHEVLFFRGQHLTEDEQLELAGRFGTPSTFPLQRVLGATSPTVSVIEDGPDSPPATDGWHTDVTWIAEPPKMAILSSLETPPYGGDTMWVSTTAVYDELSPTMRAMLDGLVAVHSNDPGFIASTVEKLGPERAAQLGIAEQLRAEYPPVEQPLIRTHPETGRRSVFYAGNFLQHIVGLTDRESSAVLAFLADQLDAPRFQCRWRWEVGDVALWDERSTCHRGVSDHRGQRRRVRRCTVDGDRPFFTVDQL